MTPAGRILSPQSNVERGSQDLSDPAEFLRNESDPAKGYCARCGGWFELADLVTDRKRPSGHRAMCKRCDSARSLEQYHRRHPRVERHCEECGVELVGQQRLVCASYRCKEARFARLHPEAAKAREAKRVERRREARRRARENVPAE